MRIVGGNHRMSGQDHDITDLLRAWTAGDSAALEPLSRRIVDELRRLARSALRGESRRETLRPTVLVNEAFLRLLDHKPADIRDRSHFFGLAGRLMRQVLVDAARERRAEKRGGDRCRIPLEAIPDFVSPRPVDLLALDQALRKLEALDPRKCQVVELRYFSGLSIPETAEALGVHHATVSRDWTTARAWLFQELHRGPRQQPAADRGASGTPAEAVALPPEDSPG
jgi:RNA polymerase sigma factor (TIGR02999 family)